MTRRSITAITVQLTLRIPPGTNAKQILGFISSGLFDHKAREDPQLPIAAIDLNGMLIKVVKRETRYL